MVGKDASHASPAASPKGTGRRAAIHADDPCAHIEVDDEGGVEQRPAAGRSSARRSAAAHRVVSATQAPSRVPGTTPPRGRAGAGNSDEGGTTLLALGSPPGQAAPRKAADGTRCWATR